MLFVVISKLALVSTLFSDAILEVGIFFSHNFMGLSHDSLIMKVMLANELALIKGLCALALIKRKILCMTAN